MEDEIDDYDLDIFDDVKLGLFFDSRFYKNEMMRRGAFITIQNKIFGLYKLEDY